jgi:hypothetical protein
MAVFLSMFYILRPSAGSGLTISDGTALTRLLRQALVLPDEEPKNKLVEAWREKFQLATN